MGEAPTALDLLQAVGNVEGNNWIYISKPFIVVICACPKHTDLCMCAYELPCNLQVPQHVYMYAYTNASDSQETLASSAIFVDAAMSCSCFCSCAALSEPRPRRRSLPLQLVRRSDVHSVPICSFKCLEHGLLLTWSINLHPCIARRLWSTAPRISKPRP